MEYRDALKTSMVNLANDSERIFLGYNVKRGSKAYGTLEDVQDKCIETPVAENLMMGLGTGLALQGFKPVIFYERHDFMLNALDSMVNHLDKFYELSNGTVNPSLIIRAVVGGTNPIYPGPQHTQDFTELFKNAINFPIHAPKSVKEVLEVYETLRTFKGPCMIIEKKDLY